MQEEECASSLFGEPEGFYKDDKSDFLVCDNYVRPSTSTSLTFSLLGEHPLWGGTRIWNAGRVLANLIDTCLIDVKGKAILELGSGSGLPSVICTLHGASSVVCTDYPDSSLIEVIQSNIVAHAPQVRVQGYQWGNDPSPLLDSLKKMRIRRRKHEEEEVPSVGFDIIIMADVLFNHSEHKALWKTINTCLKPNGMVITTLTHHRTHLQNEDLRFFSIIPESNDWKAREVGTQIMKQEMFPLDSGDLNERRKVHIFCIARRYEDLMPLLNIQRMKEKWGWELKTSESEFTKP